MQTPAGFTTAPDGKFDVTSWWAAIFTPSLPYRFAHMVTAAYISGAFVVIGISGWYLWRRQHIEFASAAFSVAMWIALVLTPLQLVLGDLHGRNTFHYQPIKVAAMEGDWDTVRGASLKLIAWPDMAAERNDFALEIPKLGSLILTHSWNGLVPGLKAVPPDDRSFVPVVFWAFRLMVGIGLVLIGISVVAVWLRWRGRLYDTRWFNMICAFSSPLPFIAVLSGWTVTEVGRQPFVVYGHLRTADAVSPVAAHAVMSSLILFVIVYTVLLIAFFAYATCIVLRGPRREPAPSPAEVRPGIDSAVAKAPAE
jgi:cytochrome d ubiquinol oxidase subunit I